MVVFALSKLTRLTNIISQVLLLLRSMVPISYVMVPGGSGTDFCRRHRFDGEVGKPSVPDGGLQPELASRRKQGRYRGLRSLFRPANGDVFNVRCDR